LRDERRALPDRDDPERDPALLFDDRRVERAVPPPVERPRAPGMPIELAA
jgi:hypothetical protein